MLLRPPDPVGVGQEVMLVVWTNHMPPTTPTDYLLGSVGNRAAWTKITATITAPDGTEQTVALPVTDPVGGTFYSFIPDKMGNYSVQRTSLNNGRTLLHIIDYIKPMTAK